MAQRDTAPTSGAGMDAGVRMNQPRTKSAQEKANDALKARLDPSHPNYIGPGYAAFDDNGQTVLRLVDPGANQLWKSQQANQASAAAANTRTNDLVGQVPGAADFTPAAPKTLEQRFQEVGGVGSSGFTPITTTTRRDVVSNRPAYPTDPRFQVQLPSTTGESTSGVPGDDGPAELDRTRIDDILTRVNRANSGIMGIAESRDQFSEGQAQLALGLQQAQRQALSIARSGNRRDSAALSARALQTNAEQAAEATRSSALLRAQEEDAERRLRLDAYKAAGDLGLNTSALELDAGRLNMESATNYLNQLFENKRLGLTLDQREAERMTNAIRDMALIGVELQKLDQNERLAIMDDITKRYGISEQTRAVMAQLDAQPGFWEQAALGLIGGAAQGGSSALATFALTSDKDKKYKTSDANAKSGASEATEDLESMLEAIGAKTWEYKDPEKDGAGRFAGPMYQDLAKTKVGKTLLAPQPNGEKKVDGARAGLTALAGLAMVFDRIKELEKAL